MCQKCFEIRYFRNILRKDLKKFDSSLLLDCGVNVGAVDKRGYTPLHLVARTANEKVMILLLDADAPVNAKSKEKFQVTRLT